MPTESGQLIEQVQVDNVRYNIASTSYVQCNTVANQQVKEVSIPSFQPINGVTLHIYFTYGNTHSLPKLKINTENAQTITDPWDNPIWPLGAVVSLTYIDNTWFSDYYQRDSEQVVLDSNYNTGDNAEHPLLISNLNDTSLSNNRTTYAIVDANTPTYNPSTGHISGTITTALSLGNSTVGSNVLPIYLSTGVPTVCSIFATDVDKHNQILLNDNADGLKWTNAITIENATQNNEITILNIGSGVANGQINLSFEDENTFKTHIITDDQSITVSNNSYGHILPRASGWLVTFSTTSASSTNLFSISNGVLQYSTLGCGNANQPIYLNNGIFTALTYTTNRVYYASDIDTFEATSHYISNDVLIINVQQGQPENNATYNFKVNGDSVFNGLIGSNLTPDTTNTYSLGNATNRWSSLYVGTANSYGDIHTPIYWYDGVPTVTEIIQRETFSFSSTPGNNTVTVGDNTSVSALTTQVIQIVVTDIDNSISNLQSPIEWSVITDTTNNVNHIQLSATTCGAINGYILFIK